MIQHFQVIQQVQENQQYPDLLLDRVCQIDLVPRAVHWVLTALDPLEDQRCLEFQLHHCCLVDQEIPEVQDFQEFQHHPAVPSVLLYQVNQEYQLVQPVRLVLVNQEGLLNLAFQVYHCLLVSLVVQKVLEVPMALEIPADPEFRQFLAVQENQYSLLVLVLQKVPCHQMFLEGLSFLVSPNFLWGLDHHEALRDRQDQQIQQVL